MDNDPLKIKWAIQFMRDNTALGQYHNRMDMSMTVTELIGFLKTFKKEHGDVQIYAMHHDGGYDHRATLRPILPQSFVENRYPDHNRWCIGGYYRPADFN